ncbi:MAG TPA: glycosyltransferase family 39 protein [Anaerolineae bacterium]|nr:glycosyltransferase family 39 protein [Anaerolineae bacterium]
MYPKNIAISKSWALGLMAAILLLGGALRMIALDRTPPGFYVDEAIESYDAYSLWRTGRDHHGVFLPIAPGGTNDYRMPLFIYSLAPLVGLTGLTVTTARLGAAFWSLLGIAGVYALGARMLNRPAGMIAAFLLAISPWQVPFGRFTHEGSAAVTTAVLAQALLWEWRARRRPVWLVGAAAMSAAGLYTYSTMKFFLPLMLLGVVVVWRRTMWAHWRQVVAAAAVGLLLVAPLLYVTLRDYDAMQARYRAVAVFQPERPLGEASAEVLRNAWYNLSPDFLFGRGDQDEIYHPKGNGQLYLAQAVLIALGVGWGLSRRERRATTLLLGVWIVLGVLPAALTIHRPGSGSGNASRSLLAVIPWQLLSGMGVAALLENSRRGHRGHREKENLSVPRLLRNDESHETPQPVEDSGVPNLFGFSFVPWVLVGLGLTLSLWVGYDAWTYFGYYFGDYAADAYTYFDGEMGAILAQVAPLADDYDAIYLTCRAGDFPYTQILFYTRYDPLQLQADLPERGAGLFAPVWRVGKYHITCETTDLWDQGLPGLYIVPEDDLPDVTPLAVIPTPPGARAYKLLSRPTFEYDFAALDWLGQCVQPVAPLNASLLARNAPAARRFEFDCTSAWVYPADGSGALLLSAGLLSGGPLDPFAQRHLGDAEVAFTMPAATRNFSPFVIYENVAAPTRPLPARGSVGPAASPPENAPATLLPAALALDGPLTFLGIAVHPAAAGVDVETWWEVASAPITRPLSLMAHRLDAAGEALEVADGFGVSPAALRPGDVVVQRHRFADLPAGSCLRLGAYWLDTMARWPIAETEAADAIFVYVE